MSFLSDYAVVTSGNEVPRVFHAWAGISCLSHAVGRQVWFDRGAVPTVYANMYLVLVGPPGVKKTTALNIAYTMIEELGGIPIAPASITKEAMIKMMGEEGSPCLKVFKHNDKPIRYSQLAIMASEFVNLINAGGNAISMIDFFTDVWDRPGRVYRDTTKWKGDFTIVGPYVSVLACMTDATAQNLLSQKIISAGMTRRCLFVHATTPGKPIPRPVIKPEQKDAWKRCVDHLRAIRLAEGGQFSETDEAKSIYDTFYFDNDANKQKEPSSIKAEFMQTKPEYVIKLAMMLALSDDPTTLTITADHYRNAIDLVTMHEDGSKLLFEGTGRNELSPIATEIVRMVELDPNPIMVKVINLHFLKHATIQQQELVIDNLIRTDQVARLVVRKTDASGKATEISYLTTPEKTKAFMVRKPAGSSTKDSQPS